MHTRIFSTVSLIASDLFFSIRNLLECMLELCISGDRFLKIVMADCNRVVCVALAIEEIKLQMNLTEWTGDPCLPVPHSWVTCSALGNPSPSIQAV